MKKELAKFMANQLIGPAYVVDNAKVNEDGSVMTFSAHGKKNTNVKITGVVKEPQQELPLDEEDDDEDDIREGELSWYYAMSPTSSRATPSVFAVPSPTPLQLESKEQSMT